MILLGEDLKKERDFTNRELSKSKDQILLLNEELIKEKDRSQR